MVFVYVPTHVFEFPINTIIAWIINDYHEQGNIIITNLLFSLGHISNRVLNNLNWNKQGHLTTKAESSMSTYTGSTVQSTPRTVLLCLQLTKGEAAKPQDKAQAPPRASTTFWKRLHLATWSINRIFALEPWKSMNIIFCPILQDGRTFIIWDHPWISIISHPRGME